MAHFAKLDGYNLVLDVIVVSNEDINNLPFPESEPYGVQWLVNWSGYPFWKQTSYNGNFRKNFAGFGYTYNAILDAFIPPKPYPSWVLNEASCQWEAPTPCPGIPAEYEWDEATLSWVKIF